MVDQPTTTPDPTMPPAAPTEPPTPTPVPTDTTNVDDIKMPGDVPTTDTPAAPTDTNPAPKV